MATLQSINASASPEVQMNQNFYAVAACALFGRKDQTTSGLTFGYYGGIIGGIGTFATIADGTVALTGSTTNYIEATTAGVVSANAVGWTAGRQPLYTAATSSTAITTLTDYRVMLPSMSTGSVTYSTLTLATGTITASTPALTVTQTWNNAAVAFIAKDTNITATANAAGSMLEQWRVGGAVKASIDYTGALVLTGGITNTAASPQLTLGVLNTTSGGIKFFGSTSGNVTLAPNVAAGASVTVTLPATTCTLNDGSALTGTAISLAGGTTQTAFANATVQLTLGGTGATSVLAIPGTLDASGTTGSVTLAGGMYIAKGLIAGSLNLGAGAIGAVGAIIASGVITMGTDPGGLSDRLRQQFDGSAATAYGVRDSSDTSGAVFIAFRKADATRIGFISRNAGTDAVLYNLTSDYRTKTLYGPYQDAASILSAMKIHDGQRKGSAYREPLLVAHEVQAITPWAVTGEKDAVDEKGKPVYQQLAIGVHEALLIAGWQDHEARLSALESRLH